MRKQSVAVRLIAGASLLLLPACASETLFRSDFNESRVRGCQPSLGRLPCGLTHRSR